MRVYKAELFPYLLRHCGVFAIAATPKTTPFSPRPSQVGGFFMSAPQRREVTEMPKMPEKDPAFLVLVLMALKENGLAMGLAFVLAWLRIQYDAKETSTGRKLLEASIGSLIVLSVGLTVREFNFSYGWALATSGFVGALGIEYVRQFGKRLAEKKADLS